MKSRTDVRKNKQKRAKSIILNSLIGIVAILILMVGGNLILNDSSTASQSEQEANGTGSDESQGQKGPLQISEDEEEDSSDIARSEPNEQEDEEAEKEKKDKKESGEKEDPDERDQEKDKKEKKSVDIGEPIGTSQTGEHTSSYEQGSVDWNEKVEAIQLVTGLDDNMTLWRLENGGSPQTSVGKVSPEGVQDWMYVVELEWVDEEGWRVTSKEKQNR